MTGIFVSMSDGPLHELAPGTLFVHEGEIYAKLPDVPDQCDLQKCGLLMKREGNRLKVDTAGQIIELGDEKIVSALEFTVEP